MLIDLADSTSNLFNNSLSLSLSLSRRGKREKDRESVFFEIESIRIARQSISTIIHPFVEAGKKKTKCRKVRTFSQLETSDNSAESGSSGTVSWINFRGAGEGRNFIARFLARILNRNSRQVLELSWPEHLRNFVQISWFSPRECFLANALWITIASGMRIKI